MVAETVPLAPVAVAPLQPPPSPSQSTESQESRPHQKDGTVTPPDAPAAEAPPQTIEKVAAPAPAPAAAPAAAAEVTPAPAPAPSTTPPLNGKQKPIQKDAGQAVLRGTLRGGAFEGRWGFGRDAVETSAFRYDARTPNDGEGGFYDGGFDLKQLTGNMRVDEALSLSIADVVDGRRTIKMRRR